MRAIGMILVLVGFFAAAFVTVREADSAGKAWQTINWTLYLASFAVGAVGVVLLRISAKAGDTHAHKLDADLAAIESSLSSVIDKVGDMLAHRNETDVYDVHKQIDEKLVDDLGAFVDARESISHIYGLQQYADLMSKFALGERSINRAWCASADGYIDEVWSCMERADVLMKQARSLLDDYKTAAQPR
jgi:hypothetical protein